MLIAIDIGNTHTVIGLFENDKLLYHWRMTSDLSRTEDETGAVLHYLFERQGFKSEDVDGVCISSVVPDLTPIYNLLGLRYFDVKPYIITSESELGLKIKYHEPKTVGADRLCNAVAGVEKYGKPLIILDFGTATTFDCINKDGDYLGGAIAPGIRTSFDVLHQKAAKLPRVEIKFPERVIGKATDESIQSGILKGSVYLIEGLIDEIRQELNFDARVVATGGLAATVSEHTKCINKVDINLSLKGIASIYKRNLKATN